MLRSYFLTALRHIRKHRLYSFINIAGLTIGFSAFILISIFVSHELSFDRFHQSSDRIMKVNLEFGDSPDVMQPVPTTPTALMPSLLANFPEFEAGTRYFNPSGFRPPVVQYGEKQFHEEGFAYADSTFFDVFSFNLLVGSEEDALTAPNSVLVTRSAAMKYFQTEDVMGKELIIYGDNFQVTGLLEDVPNNSHIQFSILASFSSHRASREETWGSANYFTYMKVNDMSNLEELREGMTALMDEVGYNSPEEAFYVNVVPVPLEDIYLYSEADALSDPSYVVIFSIIGILILVIAAVNYMNLATARSATRAREVGIRKVSGALKTQLFSQFIAEAIVISGVALVLSFVLVNLSLPLFNEISGKQIEAQYLTDPRLIGLILGVTFLVAFGSGSYPAIVLSSFKPASVLKGQGVSARKGALLRKALVVVQFSVSIFLLIATLIVGEQLSFVQQRNLGYRNNAVIAVPVNNNLVKAGDALKTTMKNTGVTESVSLAGETPTQIRGGYGIWGQGMQEGQYLSITAVAVDQDYDDVLDLNVVAGEFLNAQDIKNVRNESGEYGFVLNESAVEMLGWTPEEAVGKRVELNGRVGLIKGVIQDFHFASLHQPIGSLALFGESEWSYNYLMLPISGDLSSGIASIEEAWKTVAPDYPFSFSFLDDELGELYVAEQRLGRLFSIFSSIAIVIACMGLFGMASFIALQRMREFGVRKVLGASGKDILGLISGQFMLLVVIAFIVAAPIAYLLMDDWLSSFVYRMQMTPWHFLFAFGGAMFVALFAVSYHAIRSALMNPAEVLKTE